MGLSEWSEDWVEGMHRVGWIGRGRGGRGEDRIQSIFVVSVFDSNLISILPKFRNSVGKCRDEEVTSGTDHSPLKVIPLLLKGQ